MPDPAAGGDPAIAAPCAAFSVLVVDDEPNIQLALRRLLRSSGYEVHTASGGPEALALLGQVPVDLIISDMRMPEMSGAEFLRRARASMPDAIRILLTGYSDIASTIAAVNDGEIYRHVDKPWSDEVLLGAVRDGLARKQLERERDRLLQTVVRQHKELQEHAALLEQRVEQRTQDLNRAHAELQASHDVVRDGFLGTLRMLSHLVDRCAGLARGCGPAAAMLVQKVGPAVGLTGEPLQDTFHAALLEDLGRLGLPPRLLEAPLVALSASDRRRMQQVPLMAEACLVTLPSLAGAGRVLHHLGERWDGKGEPDGLQGATTPAGARLLRVASDYERVKAGCIEARRFGDADAQSWLRRGSGTRYDPAMVDAVVAWLLAAPAPIAARTRIGVPSLVPGMVLSHDLVVGGALLVPRGHCLDTRLIAALGQLERRQDIRLELEIARHDPL